MSDGFITSAEAPPVELLGWLPDSLEGLHLTFVTPEGTSTFAPDNADHLDAWWYEQCAKLHDPERDHWVALHRREFTTLTDSESGLPIKRLSVCFFRGDSARPLTAEGAYAAFATDAETGKPLPPMTDIVFVDFETNPAMVA